MGYEDVINEHLHRRFAGEPVARGIDPRRGGLSDNHRGGALAVKYSIEPAIWRQAVIEELDGQAEHGHMDSEQGSNIYTDFRMREMAVLTRYSFDLRDEAVYRRCQRWWRSEVALEELGEDPQGVAWLPGCRCGDAQDRRRDQARSILTTGHPRWRQNERWWRSYETNDGARMVREIVALREQPLVPIDPVFLPRLRSRMHFERYEHGVRLWCPMLDPCWGGPWWAVVLDFRRRRREFVSWRDVIPFWKGKGGGAQKMGGGPITRAGKPLPSLDLGRLLASFALDRRRPVPPLPPSPWSSGGARLDGSVLHDETLRRRAAA